MARTIDTTIAQVEARMENARFAIQTAVTHALEATSREEYESWLEDALHYVRDYETWKRCHDAIKGL